MNENNESLWNEELEIILSLNEKDRRWFHTGNCPDNSIGRYILKDFNDNKIGFVDILSLMTSRGKSKNIAYVVYAIKENFRGRGYSKTLLEKAINIAKENHFKELQYWVDNSNLISKKAVQSSGLFNLKRKLKTEEIYFRKL